MRGFVTVQSQADFDTWMAEQEKESRQDRQRAAAGTTAAGLSSPSRPSSRSRHLIRTIDAHAEGGPLRLVVHGFPSPRGRTMLEKRDWLAHHADHWRRALMLEPRGHADMCGALLTEPVSPGSHAGVLFMHNDGYATMSGHGIIAVTTIALERGFIVPAATAPHLISTHRRATYGRGRLQDGRRRQRSRDDRHESSASRS